MVSFCFLVGGTQNHALGFQNEVKTSGLEFALCGAVPQASLLLPIKYDFMHVGVFLLGAYCLSEACFLVW